MSDFIFSPTNNAIYAMELKEQYNSAGTWPSDGIVLSSEVAKEFMADPPSGKVRGVSNDGLPCWSDVPEMTEEQLIELAEQKKELLISDAKDFISLWQTELYLDSISDGNKESLKQWIAYIKELQAVDTAFGSAINWPVSPQEESE